MILTELSPLMPERASITLSRMFCEKFQVMPGKPRFELGVHRVDDLVLGPGPHRGRSATLANRSFFISRGQSFTGAQTGRSIRCCSSHWCRSRRRVGRVG